MRNLINKFVNNGKVKLVAQFYLVWFLMNVAIGLMPIFSDMLDGKGLKELFPSLLLVFVVLIASSSHMFLKQKDVPLHHRSVKFSITIVWVIILVIVSSKYPANKDLWNKYLFIGIPVIPLLTSIVSLISIALATINIFPELESDIKSAEQQQVLVDAAKATQEQNLSDFTKVDL